MFVETVSFDEVSAALLFVAGPMKERMTWNGTVCRHIGKKVTRDHLQRYIYRLYPPYQYLPISGPNYVLVDINNYSTK